MNEMIDEYIIFGTFNEDVGNGCDCQVCISQKYQKNDNKSCCKIYNIYLISFLAQICIGKFFNLTKNFIQIYSYILKMYITKMDINCLFVNTYDFNIFALQKNQIFK